MNEPPPLTTSGKRVLLVGAIAGIAFIAAMVAGVRYDQATSGHPPPLPPAPSAPPAK